MSAAQHTTTKTHKFSIEKLLTKSAYKILAKYSKTKARQGNRAGAFPSSHGYPNIKVWVAVCIILLAEALQLAFKKSVMVIFTQRSLQT